MKTFILCIFISVCTLCGLNGQESIYLRDNLRRANKGDFIVTAQSKACSLLHIYDKTANKLTIEEISIPSAKVQPQRFSWRDWVRQECPGSTSWVRYTIDLDTAQMTNFYTHTKNGWYEITQQDNFLSTLLNLKLEYVPLNERKKVGATLSTIMEKRAIWQPRMVVDGRVIEGVTFDEWKTTWPKDGSDLAGKTIEVYVPERNSSYPSYFPYWLQISGMIGKAKIRIIDSGQNL